MAQHMRGSRSLASRREATGGNNVGIGVPEEVVLSFDPQAGSCGVTINGGYACKTMIGVMDARPPYPRSRG